MPELRGLAARRIELGEYLVGAARPEYLLGDSIGHYQRNSSPWGLSSPTGQGLRIFISGELINFHRAELINLSINLLKFITTISGRPQQANKGTASEAEINDLARFLGNLQNPVFILARFWNRIYHLHKALYRFLRFWCSLVPDQKIMLVILLAQILS